MHAAVRHHEFTLTTYALLQHLLRIHLASLEVLWLAVEWWSDYFNDGVFNPT